jgi:hypothetical protein
MTETDEINNCNIQPKYLKHLEHTLATLATYVWNTLYYAFETLATCATYD